MQTIQSLTIVTAAMHEAAAAADASAARRSAFDVDDARPRARSSLIVCPASLVGHWVAESQRYFGHTPLEALALQERASA